MVSLFAFAASDDANSQTGEGGIMAPAPDGEAAVRREYEGVVRKGTREGYELFIRRHPDHPLAEDARSWLSR
ncbi:hypothetical protein [Pararhizobium arenae]|uniref:hypothetical protein n=1 Tax=Pararhizobium arenae TaxID=1856850 RepID=UPI00094AFF73|nr:hypothetical protein [Pararhizobium arenae]